MRALVVATVLASSARADAEPVVIDRGEVRVRLSIETGLDAHERGRPLSYAPDAWVGVTDRLTVGVIHSSQSVDRIDAGASFCVRELLARCERVYRGGGLDARWAQTRALAWRVRLLVRDLDPMKPAVTVGALVHWGWGKSSITTDPYLRVGLANREAGNRDALVVPVWLGRRTLAHAQVALHTGISGDLAVWRDGWHVPLGIVAQLELAPELVVGIELGFASLIGPQNTTRQTAGIVFAEWRAR